ncbi:MAG: hypothetical protein GXO08_01955 [Aquificae bacterium]|nr:hypothetical protein [Aquificota bacterium]
MENLDLQLLEAVNRLQQYALKSPVDRKGFWTEWQATFTKVKFYQIAIKALLASGKLGPEEKNELAFRLSMLKDVEGYLKELKEVALQVRGFSVFAPEESGEDDDDADDLFF